MSSNRRSSLQFLQGTVAKVKRSTSARKIPSSSEKIPRKSIDQASAVSTLVDSSSSNKSSLTERPDSRPPSISFGLLKGIACAASRSHPTVRDSIISQSLKMLRHDFPLQESDPGTEETFRNIIDVLPLHGPRIEREALHLLIIQMQNGDTGLLAQIVADRPFSDIQFIVSELLACLPESWMDTPRRSIHSALQPLFVDFSYCHPATPLVSFLLYLSRQSDSAAHAVAESGFSDAVLCLALSDYSTLDIQRQIAPSRPDLVEELFRICLYTLSVLAEHPFNHHPLRSRFFLIHKYWPSRYIKEFTQSYFYSAIAPSEPPATELDKPLLLCRLSAINSLLKWENPTIVDTKKVASDLCNLSRNCLHDIEINTLVVNCLSKFIGSKSLRILTWRAMRLQLIETPYNVIVDLLFAYIGYLLGSSYPPFNKALLADAASLTASFLDFAAFVTDESITMRTAFAEAGIMSFKQHRSSEERYWSMFKHPRAVSKEDRGCTVRTLDANRGIHVL